jgi:hypothetical protein
MARKNRHPCPDTDVMKLPAKLMKQYPDATPYFTRTDYITVKERKSLRISALLASCATGKLSSIDVVADSASESPDSTLTEQLTSKMFHTRRDGAW